MIVTIQIIVNALFLTQIILLQWQVHRLRKDVTHTFGLADNQLDEIRKVISRDPHPQP